MFGLEMMSRKNKQENLIVPTPNWGWIATFIAALFTYLFLAGLLVTSFDFNDETEKLITAKLIGSGLKIYKDIFVQHGSATYMLSHIFYKIYPSHSLAPYRLIPIFLSLLSLGAVMSSSLLTTRRARLLSGILFLFGLAAFQVRYSFVMTMYQTYAGYFYVISLAFFTLPLAFGRPIKFWQAFLAGFALAMVFFCSFSFSLSILFCFIFWTYSFFIQPKARQNFKSIYYVIAGGIIATLINILWISIYGDLKGYLVVHVYFNLKFYGYYIAFGTQSLFAAFYLFNPLIMLGKLQYHFPMPIFIFHMLGALSLLVINVVLFQLRILGPKIYRYIINFFFITCLIIYTNSRFSADFGAATYILTLICIIALTTNFIFENRSKLSPILFKSAIGMLVLFLFSGILLQFRKTLLYESTVLSYYTHRAVLGPMDNEEMRLLRSVVGENETVLQLPFSLNFYVFADRLPASGVFYWMPWMNDYVKDPVKDYPFNLCQQMNENPPKAIYYTNIDIWQHPPETFMSCFKTLLSKKYYLSPKITNVWLRNDVALPK